MGSNLIGGHAVELIRIRTAQSVKGVYPMFHFCAA